MVVYSIKQQNIKPRRGDRKLKNNGNNKRMLLMNVRLILVYVTYYPE